MMIRTGHYVLLRDASPFAILEAGREWPVECCRSSYLLRWLVLSPESCEPAADVFDCSIAKKNPKRDFHRIVGI